MSVDVKSFRRALGCFATGITVVTAAGSGGAPGVGVTINSLTSVSLEPPLVLFCLQRGSKNLDALIAAPEFAVSILTEDQGMISGHFASSATQCEWAGQKISYSARGTPLLSDCLAQLLCCPEAVHDGGDHVIVVGRIQSFEWHPEARPLLYFRGRYGKLGELFVPVSGS